MYRQEAREEYAAALKAGQKTYKELTSRDQYPYLPVLDEMLEGNVPETRRNLGILEVPSDLFEGTRTLGRRNAFAAGFLPLLSVDTEFAQKWISLCADHLGETGIHDPVKCYEYLGRFYVEILCSGGKQAGQRSEMERRRHHSCPGNSAATSPE